MHPKIVNSSQWAEAREAFLAKEKEFTRLRDELSRERRELPWEAVEKSYVFDGPKGKLTLADLFAGRGQLVIYHFMLGPGWEEGCKSCSFLADQFDGMTIHLAHRDTTFAVVSRAPLKEIEAFKKRMGWKFPWYSSSGSDFNYDYHVSFEKGSEGPGLSVFAKDGGRVFHTYSTYARGLDLLLGAYNILDLTPKGRDEDKLAFAMSWLRHHDKYDDGYAVDTSELYAPPKMVAVT